MLRTLSVVSIVLALILTLISFVDFATADEMISPKVREKNATEIVTGRVLGVYTRPAIVNGKEQVRYVVEILVDGVEKGASIKPKDVVYVRAWKPKVVGKWGGNTYKRIPAADVRVRAYCVRGNYERTGQTDSGLSGVYNEPFVVLREEKSGTGDKADDGK